MGAKNEYMKFIEEKSKELEEYLYNKYPLLYYAVPTIINTKKPFCKCLYEIHNNLRRTKFCMIACREQSEYSKILDNEKKQQEEKKND